MRRKRETGATENTFVSVTPTLFLPQCVGKLDFYVEIYLFFYTMAKLFYLFLKCFSAVVSKYHFSTHDKLLSG
jgi:hypothetical protein